MVISSPSLMAVSCSPQPLVAKRLSPNPSLQQCRRRLLMNLLESQIPPLGLDPPGSKVGGRDDPAISSYRQNEPVLPVQLASRWSRTLGMEALEPLLFRQGGFDLPSMSPVRFPTGSRWPWQVQGDRPPHPGITGSSIYDPRPGSRHTVSRGGGFCSGVLALVLSAPVIVTRSRWPGWNRVEVGKRSMTSSTGWPGVRSARSAFSPRW